TGLLVRERATRGRIRLRGFWARRARRLLPALALVVLACSAAAAFVGGDVLVGLGPQVLGAVTFSSNWLFIAQGSSYFDASAPELFRNLWSLAVEEQFYLLWPLALLALLLVPNRFVRAGIAAIIAVASALAMALLATGDGTRVYYGTDTHSFGLALGAALAFLVEARFLEARFIEARFTGTADARARRTRIALPVVGAAALAGVIALAALLPEDAAFTTRGGLALAAALTAVAILGATAPGSWLGRGLDTPVLRWIGERSYGLYLWHWPVLVLFAGGAPRGLPWWLVPSAALAVTLAAATLSYRYVEVPVRRLGFRGALSGVLAGAGEGRRGIAVAATAAIASVALFAGAGLTGAAIAADPGGGEVQQQVEHGQELLARPAYGVAPRRPQPLPTGDQILAIGDSVMLAAVPELQQAFPGIAIDAAVSRQLVDAEPIVGSLIAGGAMRPVLVIGLGTNGWIDAGTLDRLESMLDDTLLIVVNVQAPRDWTGEVNQILAEFARSQREVELSNWHDAIQPHLDVLANDDIHMGPAGARIYAAALADALQRLAELPPLIHDNERGDAARPV
ncbi:MAG: acyltransferase family protein, partial [Rhodoglobus sp.]